MQSLSVFYCFLMTKNNMAFKFVFIFNFWLLNSFDLPSYDSELRKRYTLRLFMMCLEERSFGSCPVWGHGTNDSLGGKVCLWKARGWRKLCKLTIKWASSKTISEESGDTSCAFPTGCFLDTIYWMALVEILQNMLYYMIYKYILAFNGSSSKIFFVV